MASTTNKLASISSQLSKNFQARAQATRASPSSYLFIVVVLVLQHFFNFRITLHVFACFLRFSKFLDFHFKLVIFVRAYSLKSLKLFSVENMSFCVSRKRKKKCFFSEMTGRTHHHDTSLSRFSEILRRIRRRSVIIQHLASKYSSTISGKSSQTLILQTPTNFSRVSWMG